MRERLILLLLTAVTASCDTFDKENEESTEAKKLELCKASIKDLPEIIVAEYTTSSVINGDEVYKMNALNGYAEFLVENKPNVWRYNYEFYPATEINDGFNYPFTGFLDANSPGIIGSNLQDSIYHFVDATEGNSWFNLSLPTSTASAGFILKISCECEDGTQSAFVNTTFTSVNAEDIYQGLRLQVEVMEKQLHTNIKTTAFNHQIINYPGSSIMLYAITTKIVNGEVVYTHQYDFTNPIVTQEPPLHFTDITGLPESELHDLNSTINTEVHAKFKSAGDYLIDSPATVAWPKFM